MLKEISLSTRKDVELIDITDSVNNVVDASKVQEGVCYIYTPHTTAGITINENADPSVRRDIIKELNKVIPLDDGYAHTEGNAAAHIKSTLVGSSQVVFIKDNRLRLGTWQGIYFCEFDGPRARKVWIKINEDTT